MYAKPIVRSLEIRAETATCCHIYVGSQAIITTGLCQEGQPFPTCNSPVFSGPCNVTVGPVTISGH
jgi:hypothetical protein